MIKRIAFSLFVFAGGLIFLNAVNKTAGGHPSSSGAPDEQTCARSNCHDDASIVKDSPVNTFTFGNTKNEYLTGNSYDISIQTKLAGVSKYGFEIVAIDSATKQNAGKWVITEPNRMHILSGESPFQSRSYITHSTAGTVGSDQGGIKWSFKWTAPNINKGTIMFYYVTNCTNKNDARNGDKLFISSHKIRFAGVGNIANEKIAPGPRIVIGDEAFHLKLNGEKLKVIRIMSLDGKTVYESKLLSEGEAVFKDQLHITANSLLVYQIQTDRGTYTGKLRL